MYEQARFNCRKQEDGESVDSFITDLHTLAEHCDFGALHNQLIRETIVVGIMDFNLSERLQLDSDLTLEKAVTTVHQTEMVHQQQSTIRDDSVKKPSIGAITPRRSVPPGVKPSAHKKPSLFTRSAPQPPMSCPHFGLFSPHHFKACPAKDAECQKCKKRGHY